MTRSHWQGWGGSSAYDFVIVGGGLVGCSTAYWLRRARPKARIALLEKEHLASGASGRNAGFIIQGTAANYAVDVSRLGRARARDLWARTLENRHLLFSELDPLQFGGDPVGARTVAGSLAEDEQLRRSAVLLAEDGFVARYESTTDTAAALRSEGFYGSLVVPTGATVNPVALVRTIASASTCHVVAGCEVQRILASGDRVNVETSQGTVRAGRVVVALNAYLPMIYPDLAPAVGPVRAQMLATVPVAEVILPEPVYSHQGYFYARQDSDGAVLVGGARHLHEAEEVGYEDAVTDRLQADLESYMTRHFPRLRGIGVARRWSGIMGFSPDHLPMVGEIPEVPGSYWLAGFTGHGMSLGFRIAQMVAQSLTSTAPDELTPFLESGRGR